MTLLMNVIYTELIFHFQESEACKVYAEQKEEEVKILEHSVEELDCTINVLETKVR